MTWEPAPEGKKRPGDREGPDTEWERYDEKLANSVRKEGEDRMCGNYDLTYSDLNPQFLYACIFDRQEEQEDYRAHDFAEIGVILKGEGRFFADGQEYPVEEGTLLIFNPGVCHRSVPNGTTTEFYTAFTNVQYKGCGNNCIPLPPKGGMAVKMPEKMKKQVFSICRSMEAELKNPQCGQYFMMKAYLIQMLCLISRSEETEEAAGKRSVFRTAGKKYVVEQVERYLEEHYREKISLSRIASNMYLSSFYISKIFKSETGDTPINYLISIRMEKAREILEADPEISVQKVADAVGYDDAYHFSRLFKKYYGISPLYYKSRKIEENT